MFDEMTIWHWFAIAAQIVTFAAAVGTALLTALRTSNANRARLDDLEEKVNDHALHLAAMKGLPGMMTKQFERLDSLNSDVHEIKGTITSMHGTLTMIQRSLIDRTPP